MYEVTSYSIRGKLKSLLLLLPKDERGEAKTKCKKYGGFRTSKYFIQFNWNWIDNKCRKEWEIVPRGGYNYLDMLNILIEGEKSNVARIKI